MVDGLYMSNSNLKNFDNFYADLAQSAYANRPNNFPPLNNSKTFQDFNFSEDIVFDGEITPGGKNLPHNGRVYLQPDPELRDTYKVTSIPVPDANGMRQDVHHKRYQKGLLTDDEAGFSAYYLTDTPTLTNDTKKTYMAIRGSDAISKENWNDWVDNDAKFALNHIHTPQAKLATVGMKTKIAEMTEKAPQATMDITGHSLGTIVSAQGVAGLSDEELYSEVASLLRGYEVSDLIAVGKHITEHAHLFTGIRVTPFPTTDALLHSEALRTITGSCILIKGARRFAFEQVYRRLSTQEHQTVLDIDLSAVVHNLNYYRSLLPPNHPLVCMIKADGYGIGAFELARTLQEHRVEYLAVAVADEGRELREKGIRTHLMIMNPEVASAETLFTHHLEPEVYSFELLAGLREQAVRLGVRDFPIHIKVDSGMHRLGFALEDMERLGQLLSVCPELRVSSIFSHLATADEPAKSEYVHQQYATFMTASDQLTAALGYRPQRHILNTAGIECYAEYALDMARLGIGLYGFSPTGRREVEPIARFSTVVLQVKTLQPGQYVGYGCMGQVNRPSRIAVIPVGYADGFSRRLSRGAYSVSIRGVLCPTLGNVCMDACMIDVTDVPGVEVGDQVTLFGSEDLPLAGMAEVCGTIPYEILTSISSRVQRRYWRE